MHIYAFLLKSGDGRKKPKLSRVLISVVSRDGNRPEPSAAQHSCRTILSSGALSTPTVPPQLQCTFCMPESGHSLCDATPDPPPSRSSSTHAVQTSRPPKPASRPHLPRGLLVSEVGPVRHGALAGEKQQRLLQGRRAINTMTSFKMKRHTTN